MGSMRNDYYSYPFPPLTNYDFEHGLLTKTSVYHEGGQLLSEQIHTYQRLNQGQAVQIKALAYDQMTALAFVFGSYTLLANVGKVVQTETN